MRRLGAAVAVTAVGVLALASSAPASSPPPGELVAFSGWLPERLEQSLLTVDTATHDVVEVATGGVGALAWTAAGERIVWVAFGPDGTGTSSLMSARPDGSDPQTLDPGPDIRSIATAPDGTLAWVRADRPGTADCATDPPVPQAEVVLLAPDGTRRTLSSVPVESSDLVFSPDSRTLLHRATPGDPCEHTERTRYYLTDVDTATTRPVTGPAEFSGWASFSSDGRSVVVAKSDGHGQDLVVVDVTAATSERRSTPELAESFPAFSPDGNRLAVVRTVGVPEAGIIFRRTDEPHVVLQDLDGTVLTDLGPAPAAPEQLTWTPDGSAVVLAGSDVVPACDGCDYGGADPGIWLIPVDGSGPTLLTEAGGFASAGLAVRPSPDLAASLVGPRSTLER